MHNCTITCKPWCKSKLVATSQSLFHICKYALQYTIIHIWAIVIVKTLNWLNNGSSCGSVVKAFDLDSLSVAWTDMPHLYSCTLLGLMTRSQARHGSCSLTLLACWTAQSPVSISVSHAEGLTLHNDVRMALLVYTASRWEECAGIHTADLHHLMGISVGSCHEVLSPGLCACCHCISLAAMGYYERQETTVDGLHMLTLWNFDAKENLPRLAHFEWLVIFYWTVYRMLYILTTRDTCLQEFQFSLWDKSAHSQTLVFHTTCMRDSCWNVQITPPNPQILSAFLICIIPILRCAGPHLGHLHFRGPRMFMHNCNVSRRK